MEEYTLIRRQRKTLTMKLDKDGNITVLAPLYIRQEAIDSFVCSHTTWITKKRNELILRQPLPTITLTEGERIPLWGVEYCLHFWDKRIVKTENDCIFLPRKNSRAALVRYYGKQLNAAVLPLISDYSRKLGVVATAVHINSARTRWGSCSGKNSINFSFRLAMCDRMATEYVVVHELCHIIHKNHSKEFWSSVMKYYPNVKQAKKYLKEKSYFMEII